MDQLTTDCQLFIGNHAKFNYDVILKYLVPIGIKLEFTQLVKWSVCQPCFCHSPPTWSIVVVFLVALLGKTESNLPFFFFSIKVQETNKALHPCTVTLAAHARNWTKLLVVLGICMGESSVRTELDRETEKPTSETAVQVNATNQGLNKV